MSDVTDDALLAAIHAAPDDDAPRAIYADHLIARGDPRGEFIQLQLALADPFALDDKAHKKANSQATALSYAHEAVWLAPLRSVLPDLARSNVDFKRGFPASLGLRVEQLHAVPRMCELEPTIRRVRVSFEPLDELANELDHVAAATISSLSFFDSLPNLDEAIANAPWTRLRELSLDRFDDAQLARLADAPQLAPLTNLALSSDRSTAAGMRVIANAPWRLRDYFTVRATVDAPYLAALATGPAFRSLRSLFLGKARLGDGLGSLGALTELRDLRLWVNDLQASTLDDILAALTAPLEHLDVSSNSQLGDAGAHVLAASPKLASLRSLNITRTNYELSGLQALVASPHLAKLGILYAHHDAWTRHMADAVARAPFKTSRRL